MSLSARFEPGERCDSHRVRCCVIVLRDPFFLCVEWPLRPISCIPAPACLGVRLDLFRADVHGQDVGALRQSGGQLREESGRLRNRHLHAAGQVSWPIHLFLLKLRGTSSRVLFSTGRR